MSDLTMVEAALFQLRASLQSDPGAMGINIAANLVGNAVAAAKEQGVNAATVNDIVFALKDLISAIDEDGAPDEAFAAVALLQSDVARLRTQTAVPAEVIAAIRALQAKLRTRKSALERNQYRPEGTPEPVMPHDPAELREEAIPLARQLSSAGFVTPILDQLIEDPQSIRYHSINELIDELDVIQG